MLVVIGILIGLIVGAAVGVLAFRSWQSSRDADASRRRDAIVDEAERRVESLRRVAEIDARV